MHARPDQSATTVAAAAIMQLYGPARTQLCSTVQQQQPQLQHEQQGQQGLDTPATLPTHPAKAPTAARLSASGSSNRGGAALAAGDSQTPIVRAPHAALFQNPPRSSADWPGVYSLCTPVLSTSCGYARAQALTLMPPERRNVDVGAFVTKLYQWAATLTSSGRNMPLALPLRTDRTADGILVRAAAVLHLYKCLPCPTLHNWLRTLATCRTAVCVPMHMFAEKFPVHRLQMQLLRVVNNRAVSVADIAVVVEPVPDVVRPSSTWMYHILCHHEPVAGASLHGCHICHPAHSSFLVLQCDCRGIEVPCFNLLCVTGVMLRVLNSTDAEMQGNVLFVRFYEGEGAKSAYKFSGGLQQLIEQLIDVPQIVNSMPPAIRTAIMQSRD